MEEQKIRSALSVGEDRKVGVHGDVTVERSGSGMLDGG